MNIYGFSRDTYLKMNSTENFCRQLVKNVLLRMHLNTTLFLCIYQLPSIAQMKTDVIFTTNMQELPFD